MSDMARIAGAFLLWLALFSAIYGLHGIGCAASWSTATVAGLSLYRLVLVAAATLAVLAQGAVLAALRHPRLGSASPFVQAVGVTLATAALVAQAWSLFPVALLTACV